MEQSTRMMTESLTMQKVLLLHPFVYMSSMAGSETTCHDVMQPVRTLHSGKEEGSHSFQPPEEVHLLLVFLD